MPRTPLSPVFILLGVLVLGTLGWSSDDPTDPARVALRRDVRQLLVEERADAALAVLGPALERYPEDAGLHALHAEAYFSLERFSEAVGEFERAVKLDESLRGRVFNHGRALQELDRHEDAILVFEAMQKEDAVARQVRGAFGIGLSRETLGDESLAAAAYRAALTLDPKFLRARYRLAVLDLGAGRVAQAESALNAVLSADPLHHGAAYNRALALARLERDSESEAAWVRYRSILEGKQRISLLRERLEGTAVDFEALLELGHVHAELGAHAPATEWFGRAGGIRPLDPRPAVATVASLRALGRASDAERLCRMLLERVPPFEELRQPLVELLEARGEKEEAARWRRPGG